jgi:hypothetical protein
MSSAIDLTRYICGGYFLTKRASRPECISKLVPDSILTVSSCFTDVAPEEWADGAYDYDEKERAAEALKFGIAASAIPTLVNLFTAEIAAHHHITTAFPSLLVAQEFYQCADRAATALLGIGLERSLLPSFYAQRGDDINNGYGLTERVEAKQPLARGGQPLGFEPLGFEATKFHTWLCHDAPREASEQFAIKPNQHGFIDTLDDAMRVTEHLKATGAEPAIWEPWLIVNYSEQLNHYHTCFCIALHRSIPI